jgi:hypothetical protein
MVGKKEIYMKFWQRSLLQSEHLEDKQGNGKATLQQRIIWQENETIHLLNHILAKYWDGSQAPSGEREKSIGHLVNMAVADGWEVSVDGS